MSADAEGWQIVGVMHSHTHTTAYPSPTDVSDASAFDPFGGFRYVIVSLKDATPVLRNYRIIDGRDHRGADSAGLRQPIRARISRIPTIPIIPIN